MHGHILDEKIFFSSYTRFSTALKKVFHCFSDSGLLLEDIVRTMTYCAKNQSKIFKNFSVFKKNLN